MPAPSWFRANMCPNLHRLTVDAVGEASCGICCASISDSFIWQCGQCSWDVCQSCSAVGAWRAQQEDIESSTPLPPWPPPPPSQQLALLPLPPPPLETQPPPPPPPPPSQQPESSSSPMPVLNDLDGIGPGSLDVLVPAPALARPPEESGGECWAFQCDICWSEGGLLPMQKPMWRKHRSRCFECRNWWEARCRMSARLAAL